MIALARILTRLVGIALLTLLAVGGAAAAVFCISGGHGTLSLPALAGDIHLPQLRDDIGAFLNQVSAHGSIAVVAGLAGLAAVALGALLLAGAWLPTRQRVIVLDHTPDGALAATRRPLAQAVTALALQPSEVIRARTRARARRGHDGGRVRVRVRAASPADKQQAGGAAATAVAALAQPLALRVRVRARKPPKEKQA